MTLYIVGDPFSSYPLVVVSVTEGSCEWYQPVRLGPQLGIFPEIDDYPGSDSTIIISKTVPELRLDSGTQVPTEFCC